MSVSNLIPAAEKKAEADKIIKVVCNAYSVTEEDLISPSRVAPLATIRQLAMILCYERTSMSLVDVGQYFGGREHGVVIYARKKINAIRRTRKGAEVIEKIIEKIEE